MKIIHEACSGWDGSGLEFGPYRVEQNLTTK